MEKTTQKHQEYQEYLRLEHQLMTHSVTAYELLNNTSLRAREEFLQQTSLVQPNNQYGKMPTVEELDIELRELRALRDEAETKLKSYEVLWGLFQKVYYHVHASLSFIRANASYNQTRSTDGKEKAKMYHRRDHFYWNKRLYGEPDRATFERLFADKMQGLKKYKVHQGRPDFDQLYEEILQLTGQPDASGAPLYRPQPETVQRFGEMIQIFFGDFYARIPQQPKIPASQMVDILNEFFTEMDEECHFENGRISPRYGAQIDHVIGNMSVNHQERVVRIPVNRVFSYEEALRLPISHELGVHILRAIAYKVSDIEVLSGSDLPGYEEFEEGLATCIEQALAGEYSPSRMERYIGIGLAYFRKLNFRDIFEVMWRMEYLSKVLCDMSEPERQNLKADCRCRMFNETQRIFRGTCELVNFKDLMYYRGNVQVWKYIEAHLNDPEQLFFDLFLSGKTNILDQSQKQLIDKLHEPKLLSMVDIIFATA